MLEEKDITAEYIWNIVRCIQCNRPVIHCITNAVTVNDCANVLLAVGASPTMAHHPLEAAEISAGAAALVCNFGAIDDYDAMLAAGQQASLLGHPVVVDPVGVSGSSYRRNLCLEYMDKIHPVCVRGNYSEIRALIQNCSTVTGVDAAVSESDIGEKKRLFHEMGAFARKHGMILIASGETDLIADGVSAVQVYNGHPDMTKITGTGCMSSVMLGAFLSEECSVQGAAAACVWMGIAGELAAQWTHAEHGGTMTFRARFIDEMSLLKPEDMERLRIKCNKNLLHE